MNKDEFLHQLSRYLKDVPKEEIKDILFDYEEHFRIGMENGRKEEEIAEALGNPKTIAKQIRASYVIRKAKETPSAGNVFRAVFTAIALILFNLVFMVGIFIGMLGVLVGLFAVAAAIIVSGIALFFGTIFRPIFPQYINIPANPIVSIFLGIGFACIGIIFLIGVLHLAKWFYKITNKYVKMNLNIITNRRSKNEE